MGAGPGADGIPIEDGGGPGGGISPSGGAAAKGMEGAGKMSMLATTEQMRELDRRTIAGAGDSLSGADGERRPGGGPRRWSIRWGL